MVPVVAGAAALAAGLIYAYNRFEGFRNVVDAVASFLTGTVWPAMQAFAAGVVVVFNEVVHGGSRPTGRRSARLSPTL